MKKAIVIALAAILVTATAAQALEQPSNARVRGVVLFLGDSNLMFGAGAIEEATTFDSHFDNGYVPVIASRTSAGIRTRDCPGDIYTTAYSCPTYNYWSLRIPRILNKVKPDAVVVDLGIVDDFFAGTATSQGYGQYGAKIDWFMRLLPKKIPILWSNLPCPLEDPLAVPGCQVTNAALQGAGRRWKNFHLVNWAALAQQHPEWMLSDNIHYTADGNTAWAALVVTALDRRLKYPAH